MEETPTAKISRNPQQTENLQLTKIPKISQKEKEKKDKTQKKINNFSNSLIKSSCPVS